MFVLHWNLGVNHSPLLLFSSLSPLSLSHLYLFMFEHLTKYTKVDRTNWNVLLLIISTKKRNECTYSPNQIERHEKSVKLLSVFIRHTPFFCFVLPNCTFFSSFVPELLNFYQQQAVSRFFFISEFFCPKDIRISAFGLYYERLKTYMVQLSYDENDFSFYLWSVFLSCYLVIKTMR